MKRLLADCPSSSEEERMAFQSIKKLLPDSCRCMNESLLGSLMEGVIRPPLALPPGYLRFVQKEAARIFPDAWDVSYREHCYTTSPPLSSTLENGRTRGGGLATRMTHSAFLEQTLGTHPLAPSSVHARPMVVQSAGKPRPLTKFSEDCLTLKPLHKALYDRISLLGWVCRGDVTAEKLDRAGFGRGNGDLVSGDYKSATDNLPLEVAEEILRVALRRASRVPEGIADFATRILRPIFLFGGEQVEVSSGQQMGSLLSFPLLCVQNYIAFRWAQAQHFGAVIKEMPVLINGDDILFQTRDPTFFGTWVEVVGAVGLEVERTKTSVSGDFGSLNSTLVRWKSGFLRVVPTLRFGLLRPQPYANSLPRSLQQFAPPGLPADVRYSAGIEFIRWHSSTLRKTNLSPHEIGFSGRFAWRVLNKGGGLEAIKKRLGLNPADSLCKRLPSLPCPHNVAMTSEDVEWVSSLTREEERLNARELAAWKWRKVGTFEKEVRALELRYWMGLSLPSVDVARLTRLADSVGGGVVPDWYQRAKTAYFAPRKVVEKKVFLMRGIDRLPTYDEAVRLGDTRLDEGPPDLIGKSNFSDEDWKSYNHFELGELIGLRWVQTA